PGMPSPQAAARSSLPALTPALPQGPAPVTAATAQAAERDPGRGDPSPLPGSTGAARTQPATSATKTVLAVVDRRNPWERLRGEQGLTIRRGVVEPRWEAV